MLRAVILAGASAAVLTGATAASAAGGLASRPDHTASANGRVAAIVRVGGTVYLGGSFTSITRKDGTTVARNRLAAIDAATGDPTSWNPNANGVVLGEQLRPGPGRLGLPPLCRGHVQHHRGEVKDQGGQA